MFDYLRNHIAPKNLKILDWGCGPARIIRHLPSFFQDGCSFYASDYNAKTIQWCKKNIENVSFSINELAPPSGFQSGFFDLVYAFSIITHLSEELHEKWINEIRLTLKPGGFLLITTQGKAFREKLTAGEQIQFDNNELVVRSDMREGHRVYSAFQPEKYMDQLFHGFEVVDHIKPQGTANKPEQDIWLVKKL